ncbi:hypothetical protein JW992_11665 [candidate division KSB1 bacterium]|nr:hypothetical protein [candidate division KSB1 bacterium]
MKVWKKTRNQDFGALIQSWRHKNTERFWMRILTWILTGFVFALATSIMLGNLLGLEPDLTQCLARIVFFVTVIIGIIDSYFSNIVLGVETRLYEKALVQVQPPVVLEWLAFLQKRPQPRIGYKYEYLPLAMIKSVQLEKNELVINLTGAGSVSQSLPVIPVVSYHLFSGGQQKELVAPVSRYKLTAKDSKFSNQAVASILSGIKEVKRRSV